MTAKTTGEGLPIPGPGRDSAYSPEMNDMARKLALLGLTDEEMATFFGVHVSTYYRWKNENPAFHEAVNAGKLIADANVAESLYKRATGEHVQVEKVIKKDGVHEVIKVMTYIPGEAGAAMNWLKNRRRQDWQDKVDHSHSGTIELTTKEQRDAAVAAATRADS
jgi:hypothetical protein